MDIPGLLGTIRAMAKRKTGREESCSGAGQNSRTGHDDAMRNTLPGLAVADRPCIAERRKAGLRVDKNSSHSVVDQSANSERHVRLRPDAGGADELLRWLASLRYD